MRSKSLSLVFAVLLPLAVACGTSEEPTSEPASAAASAPVPAAGDVATSPPPSTDAPAATTDASVPGADAGTPPPAAPAAPPAAGPVLASQETNWSGIVAEVTEFRRKGNTLTAKVRLRNQGSAPTEADLYFSESYLMDAEAGKKYEVLKDEKGAYIASLLSGWSNRWYGTLAPGASTTLWMKFPAPPPEVKVVTLQLPSVQPFDDLAIQDL